MSIKSFLKSEMTIWLLGAILLSGLSAFAYSMVGWLGIGIIGLMGLVISTTIDLHSGNAMADSGFGSGDVPMYARQLEEARNSQSSPEQKKAAAAEQAKRSRTLGLLNLVFIAMSVVGFWIFVRHQLKLF